MTDYRPHVVEQGEYLTLLAGRHAVDDDSLWSHPKNSALRNERDDKNMLLPGDVVFVPEAKPTWLPISTGGSNKVKVNVPLVRISVAFSDAGGPLRKESYVVEGADIPPDTTDEQGAAHFSVPVSVRTFRVVFAHRSEAFELRVGHLDPADTPSGARHRLGSLGIYGRPGGTSAIDGDPAELAAGLRIFQVKALLPVTGKLDKATVSKLTEVFGC